MKKLILFFTFLSIRIFSQEIVTESTQAPFSRYYDNGNIQQSGYVTILNLYNKETCTYRYVSVVDSTWSHYDTSGKLIQISHYKLGTKCDVWQYYFDDYIGQVAYDNEGVKYRYLEVSYTGKLIYKKDF